MPNSLHPVDCSTPGFPAVHYLPEFTQIHVHRVGDATQPSHALLSPSSPVLNLYSIRGFSNESALGIRWLKDWRFSISTSNDYSGLISFRIDLFDLLAFHGTHESSATPQFKSISSSGLNLLYGPALTSIHNS